MNHFFSLVKHCFVISLFVFCFVTNANDIMPTSSTSDLLDSIETPFNKGDTQSIIEFNARRGHSFLFSIAIPIKGAHFELIDADGSAILDDQHRDVRSDRGEVLTGITGVIYQLPLIHVANRQGTWKLIVKYKAPGYESAIASQIFTQITLYEKLDNNEGFTVVGEQIPSAALTSTSNKNFTLNAKVTIPGHLAVVGDKMSPSILVKANGSPIPNAKVLILITYPDGTSFTVPGLDNGLGFDLESGDGIYSSASTYPYRQLGEHLVEATVTAKHFGHEYQTQTGKNIVVTEQFAIVNKTEIITPQDTCVNNVVLQVSITIKKAGVYSIYNSLRGSLDHRFGIRVIERMNLSQGEHEIELIYNKKALAKRFSQGEIISFSPLLVETTDYSKSGTREFNSVVNPHFSIPDTFQLKDIDLCRQK